MTRARKILAAKYAGKDYSDLLEEFQKAVPYPDMAAFVRDSDKPAEFMSISPYNGKKNGQDYLGGRRNCAKKVPDTFSLSYIVRDKRTGTILKVGETGTWEFRFGEYARRAREEFREINITTFKFDTFQKLDRVAIERQMRITLKREGHVLPWDDSRIGRQFEPFLGL